MHPFLDGNGRTARALEALMLQHIGLRDTLFIAMSNYYYDEKTAYLQALNESRAGGHDLTPFLRFALAGIERQCRRLLDQIRTHVAKALYRNTVTDLFGRLASARKRVMTERHVRILNLLLNEGPLTARQFIELTSPIYKVRNPRKALARDFGYLFDLGAISVSDLTDPGSAIISANLNWPMQISETEFLRLAKELPKVKVHGFLSS